MATARIFPINRKNAAGNVDDNSFRVPKAAMQSITMSLRFGVKDMAIGYIQSFNWTQERAATPYHQIEAYPNGTFGGGSIATADFMTSQYWPGEVCEVVPGKVGPININLSKIAFYSSNLLRSLLTINSAGTEEKAPYLPPTDNNVIHYDSADGQNNYVTAIQQVRPIYIKQMFISPITGTVVFGRTFEECWFTNISEQIPEAGTNAAVIETATLMATRIRPYVLTPPTNAEEINSWQTAYDAFMATNPSEADIAQFFIDNPRP